MPGPTEKRRLAGLRDNEAASRTRLNASVCVVAWFKISSERSHCYSDLIGCWFVPIPGVLLVEVADAAWSETNNASNGTSHKCIG